MKNFMKWRLCQCEVNGLVRPTNGPLRIKKTEMVEKDVLKAQLTGPKGGTAVTVRHEGKFYFRGPDKKVQEVPADTLTDALHASVWMANEEMKAKKRLPHQKRPMPHVSVGMGSKKPRKKA